jgi:hypothetical protein
VIPDALAWVVVIVLALALVGAYLGWTAGRVDRMQGRVEAARSALDAALQRRSAVALEIAVAGLLDPASAVLLADSAHRARSAPTRTREQAESDLSRALVAALDSADAPAPTEPGGASDASGALYLELAEAARRVQLARRFYNDAVRASVALRRHRLVRWFRLAGHARLPRPADFDDNAPALPRA